MATKNLDALRHTVDYYAKDAMRQKKCNNCGDTARGIDEIDEKFGHRWSKGHFIPQAWCLKCRREDIRTKRAEAKLMAGFVKPELPVLIPVTGLHLQPPGSGLYLQQCGRALRPVSRQPIPIVFDHAAKEDDWIPAERADLQALYYNNFPKDKNWSKRSYNFMVNKLRPKITKGENND